MTIQHSIEVNSTHRDGRPNYRFYKLVYTAALRLQLALPLTGNLEFKLAGEDTGQAKYKSRTTYVGTLSVDGNVFENITYVVDALPRGDELVTFWKKSQPGDAPGSKGGAHQFAEAYLGYLSGKMLESQTFSPAVIANELRNLQRRTGLQYYCVDHPKGARIKGGASHLQRASGTTNHGTLA